jgi:hypothetical protein
MPSRGRFYAVSLSGMIVLARCHIVAVDPRRHARRPDRPSTFATFHSSTGVSAALPRAIARRPVIDLQAGGGGGGLEDGEGMGRSLEVPDPQGASKPL